MNSTTILVMRSLKDYPPGLIGTVSSLFGRTMAASHGVDWTLDAMIAEEQSKFFNRFDPERDRVWVAMEENSPKGALTIEGPRQENGQNTARLRFFILDESLRGRGLGRSMMAAAMAYCRERRYRGVFLTTMPGLDAALRIYRSYGFTQVGESEGTFHGSDFVEITLETRFE